MNHERKRAETAFFARRTFFNVLLAKIGVFYITNLLVCVQKSLVT